MVFMCAEEATLLLSWVYKTVRYLIISRVYELLSHGRMSTALLNGQISNKLHKLIGVCVRKTFDVKFH